MIFALFLIFFSEGIEADVTDTIHMPELLNEVYPVLAAVRPFGATEKLVGSGIVFIHQCYKIVFVGRLLLLVEAHLTVHGFKLCTYIIHSLILMQHIPFVKGEVANLLGICLVGFDTAQGVVVEILD